MIEGVVKEALENARGWIISQFTDATTAVLAPFLDPLWQWYAYGAAAFLAAFVIGWFFPFKWVRAALGFILLLVAAFIAGGRQMNIEMKSRLKGRRK